MPTAKDPEWERTEAGYTFVESMIPRADDRDNLMWYGWALREAFIAGAKWQKEQDNASR